MPQKKWVRVGPWVRHRELRESENALEVATCRECDTCMERMMFVSESLSRHGVTFRWLREGRRVFLQLNNRTGWIMWP